MVYIAYVRPCIMILKTDYNAANAKIESDPILILRCVGSDSFEGSKSCLQCDALTLQCFASSCEQALIQ